MQNWDDLRFFLAVSKHGSMSAAAQALGVDQSTVFRRLRALEAYLGAQIFDRRQHGRYALTAAGERLAEQTGRIEAATFIIEREVLGRDLQLSGNIRVTTAEDIALSILPRHLLAFNNAYPAISIDLLTANRYFSLGRGEADVAIRPGFSSNEGRVIPRRICRTYFGLFAKISYLRQAGTPQTHAELDGHRVIGWRGELTEEGFDEYLNQVAKAANSYGSNSLVAQRALAEGGLGIALLPEFLGQMSKQLVRVMPATRIDSGYLWILHHDELRRAARVRAFVDFMATALAADPALNLIQSAPG